MSEAIPDPTPFEQLQSEASAYFADYRPHQSMLIVNAFAPLITGAKPGVPVADRTIGISDPVYRPYYGEALPFSSPVNKAALGETSVVWHAGIQLVQKTAPLTKVVIDGLEPRIIDPATPISEERLELPLGVIGENGQVFVYDQQETLHRVNSNFFSYSPYDALSGLELDGTAQMNAHLMLPWSVVCGRFVNRAAELSLTIDPVEHVWREVNL